MKVKPMGEGGEGQLLYSRPISTKFFISLIFINKLVSMAAQIASIAQWIEYEPPKLGM